MILTTKQALSFVDAISKGAPKHFFDALLGTGQTPKVDDFTTDDAERLDAAKEFLDCVQSVTNVLVKHLQTQPRQTSLLTEFDKQAKKKLTEFDKQAKKELAKKKPKSSMDKFKDSIGKKKTTSMSKKKPAKKKPAKK